MRLISINTSRPTQVEYQGKIISTGIFKKPVTGKVYVAKENLQGDQQADLKSMVVSIKQSTHSHLIIMSTGLRCSDGRS